MKRKSTLQRLLDLETQGLAALEAGDHKAFKHFWNEREKLFPKLSENEWDILTAEVN